MWLPLAANDLNNFEETEKFYLYSVRYVLVYRQTLKRKFEKKIKKLAICNLPLRICIWAELLLFMVFIIFISKFVKRRRRKINGIKKWRNVYAELDNRVSFLYLNVGSVQGISNRTLGTWYLLRFMWFKQTIVYCQWKREKEISFLLFFFLRVVKKTRLWNVSVQHVIQWQITMIPRIPIVTLFNNLFFL